MNYAPAAVDYVFNDHPDDVDETTFAHDVILSVVSLSILTLFLSNVPCFSSSMQLSTFPAIINSFATPQLTTLYEQYKLRLVASDNLNENYTTVVIHIKDVNDNPPDFDRPTYETQITEEDDRHLPKRVLQVN